MTSHSNDDRRSRTPLRVWPGVAAVLLAALVMFVVPLVMPGTGGIGIPAGLGGAVLVLLWWLAFSRAPWVERLGAILLMVVVAFATRPLLHASIQNGMMGMMFAIYVIPVLAFALVAWALVSRGLAAAGRRAALVAAVVLACGAFTLLRTAGITGDADSDFEWRWTPTPEERLLARSPEPIAPISTPPAAEPSGKPAAPAVEEAPAPVPAVSESPEAPAPAATTPTPAASRDPDVKRVPVWPGFRGPGRDSVIRGVRIQTDWSASPPVELWRRPIGPGWGSFAVDGNLIFTQEQRGEHEVVSCYRIQTGEPVWMHRDAARFWESNGGAGPRATPTVHNRRVYTLGATGILNVLDESTGSVIWSRSAAADTGAELPGWGFAGSPLIADDSVIVATSGRLASYDLSTGELRWTRRTVGGGYSSPQLVTIDGMPQIVLQSGGGATGIGPADGAVLWEHRWEDGASIVQPGVIANGDLLVSGAGPMGANGMRRISASRSTGGWSLEERWTSRGLKPYFNDFVVHEGHAYGFDGSIMAAIDVETGERKWKGGRYGHGQLVLLPDQDLLLVLSEEGELALVSATPDNFTEISRFKAIEGKTWNHPVLVRDVLLVRNGEEMAAFRLSPAR